jgi:uncharacterized protein with von Willebrand factor type A (vWA) domain
MRINKMHAKTKREFANLVCVPNNPFEENYVKINFHYLFQFKRNGKEEELKLTALRESFSN